MPKLLYEMEREREPVGEYEEDSMGVMKLEEPIESTQDDQPVSKRRIIRSQYRQIENRINEEKDQLSNGDSDRFIAFMNEVENIHKLVDKPREQVADAEAFFGLTRTLVASVKAHTSGGVTPTEFVSCLIRDFGQRKTTKELLEKSQNISWTAIGSCVSPFFMNGSGCMTMIGPMKSELKPRKLVVCAKRTRSEMQARRRSAMQARPRSAMQARPRSAMQARPRELNKPAEVVTDTDRNVHLMFEILKKEKRVKVENLILHRNSFAQTVENLFALSFLVKDGRVRIDVDESGSQFAVPRNGPSAEEIKSGAAKNHHFIFRFDFKDWELMRTCVPEGEELMKPRVEFARAEPGCGGYCSQEVVPSDSELIYTAIPIKKLSRIYMAIPWGIPS